MTLSHRRNVRTDQMNYDEAVEAEVTREQARAEIAKHDADGGFEQFLVDVGDRASYSGAEVLAWLGY